MPNNYTLRRLQPDDIRKSFDCGDSDLTEFFLEDSIKYARQLLAVTYAYESKDETVAYFSVHNDRIQYEDADDRVFKFLKKRLPHGKPKRSFPAVKIGRFAVNVKYKGQGIGTELMSFIKYFFVHMNKTGCRFITIDANNTSEALGFYEKNGFKYLAKAPSEHGTFALYHDLKPMADTLAAPDNPTTP